MFHFLPWYQIAKQANCLSSICRVGAILDVAFPKNDFWESYKAACIILENKPRFKRKFRM